MNNVILYTDGSASPNPGDGGYGGILQCNEHKRKFQGWCPDTTNNRMELAGVIEGLKLLKFPCNVTVYTDSKYVCNAVNHQWLTKWLQNGWRTSTGAVKNIDLWKQLLGLLNIHNVTFNWVKGHASNEYNNLCDKLATEHTGSCNLCYRSI